MKGLAREGIGNPRPRRRSARTFWKGTGRVSVAMLSGLVQEVELTSGLSWCSRSQMSSTQKGLVDAVADQGRWLVRGERTAKVDHPEPDRRGRENLGRALVSSRLPGYASIDGAVGNQLATATTWTFWTDGRDDASRATPSSAAATKRRL
jgi:hypothetical protein